VKKGRTAGRALLSLPLEFASSFEQWDSVQTVNFQRGTAFSRVHGAARTIPDTKEYVAAMLQKAYGKRNRPEAYLGRSFTTYWSIRICRCSLPCSKLRVLRPWRRTRPSRDMAHFMWKGSLRRFPARALVFSPRPNSPPPVINADDSRTGQKGQWGLEQGR